MNYKFFPHTQDDVKQMLDKCGLKSLDELYNDIPEELQFKRDYDLPRAMSEIEVRNFFADLAMDNTPLKCFMGAGVYDHYTPAVVQDIVNRSEFLTSYTPYQAEISQGTLQYIFEYQSMMAELTGMEVSNASMYDGCTATAEAMMMAVANAKKRNKVLMSETINPFVAKVVLTYAKFHGIDVEFIEQENGVTSRADFEAKVGADDVAGVIVASPNYYGILEDYTGWADYCHEHKTLLIMNCPASALSVIKTPAEWGADIAVGDGQSLGIPMNFGGPYVGYLCTSKKLIRKMPGRIVGATTDADGKRAFVLTLQAREQHIRREKATSNICSNQSLMALFVTVYMSLMGKQGLREVNEISYSNAHYLADQLVKTGKFELEYPDKPFLNEFAVKTSLDVDDLLNWLNQAYAAGVPIDDGKLLMCATETVSKEDIDDLIEAINHFIEEGEEDNNNE
mgnify:FL=1